MAVLEDETRVKALPTRHELEVMTPQERANAADEMILQFHACATVDGGDYSAEDLDRARRQK